VSNLQAACHCLTGKLFFSAVIVVGIKNSPLEALVNIISTNRQHLSCGNFLMDLKEELFCAILCITVVNPNICNTHVSSSCR